MTPGPDNDDIHTGNNIDQGQDTDAERPGSTATKKKASGTGVDRVKSKSSSRRTKSQASAKDALLMPGKKLIPKPKRMTGVVLQKAAGLQTGRKGDMRWNLMLVSFPNRPYSNYTHGGIQKHVRKVTDKSDLDWWKPKWDDMSPTAKPMIYTQVSTNFRHLDRSHTL